MKIHKPTEYIENPALALQMLKEGNVRYLEGKHILKSNRQALSNGQKPFAVVLACSDSRVVPEIFFNQKLGNIFVIRNAGNIADTTALGSLEYAINDLKSKLIVVCGHSKCGAVRAAYSGQELSPNIKHIVEYIKPAVENCNNVDEIIHNNVNIMVERIKANEIVKHLEVLVVGAYYDIDSGVVKWL